MAHVDGLDRVVEQYLKALLDRIDIPNNETSFSREHSLGCTARIAYEYGNA
jgi:hypothetical protein